MRYVVEHMCGGLLNNAFSLILRDWYDFAATVSGPPSLAYPMSAVSNSLAVFLGTMADGLRNTVEEYGAERDAPGRRGVPVLERLEPGLPRRVPRAGHRPR
jgi:N-methylhydantoinase B